ncbi:ABC-type dipeptide/oligopeptide/nickel transport system, ATPase component [Arthrobacter sp. yr096]|uniref:dipeptide/oligopeptide/nickel ABC transporter permease/ATP-binding protein n=1 Tax=Arthrobacter sp. yr096 TaxID=1761750 RepID=UPI0008CB1BD2|nr:dipeptide/oligopeptide/nickel ABC transporter permease/ATP-binding protein [Arthrobacter sp. yr096]SEI97355.1 ABC-type dipeptide/oligopeptide/nickel transport system, ATPase component [Arthrobacter sp. yr096]
MAEIARPRRRFRWTTGLIVGIVMMSIMVLTAILAPMFLTEAAEKLTPQASQGPSPEHWLGTDDFGRDVLARSLVATRLTLLMTAATTAIAVVAGIAIGTAVWLAPRRIRAAVLRVIEAAVAYPSLIFSLLIAAILGQGTWSAVLAISIASIPAFARLTANMAASISQRNYVSTARLLGVSGPHIITRHLLPNMAEPLLVLTATVFATTLIDLSSLSFIGLGVQNPEYDFGRLLNEGLVNIYSQPLQAVMPSIMITITGLSAMLIGDGLAAATDPRGGRKFGSLRKASEVPASLRADAEALVEVDNLTVTTPSGLPLVKGVSLSIHAGEVVGLVGESGSGKSLTAMSIAGLLPEELGVSAKTMRLGELNLLKKNNPRELATSIGLVYQDPGTSFNPALRIGSQLTEVSRVHLGQSRGTAFGRMIKALADIRITQPEKRMKQHPHELSGGMLQRAMIASTLVTDPRLIIADEPTTALDVTVQADVLRQFRTINREMGTAMLFISHDIGVVQALCDKVIVMNGGKILERLTGEELAAGKVKHPYTKALLAATPSIAERKAELVTISAKDFALDEVFDDDPATGGHVTTSRTVEETAK